MGRSDGKVLGDGESADLLDEPVVGIHFVTVVGLVPNARWAISWVAESSGRKHCSGLPLFLWVNCILEFFCRLGPVEGSSSASVD